MSAAPPTRSAMVAVAVAVLRRPRLWPAALAALARLAAPGWWHRAPFLPVPDARLWSFRMVTAYGSPDAVPVPADVVSYLEWCRGSGPVGSAVTRERPRDPTPGPGPG
jgi:hypothetical protein